VTGLTFHEMNITWETEQPKHSIKRTWIKVYCQIHSVSGNILPSHTVTEYWFWNVPLYHKYGNTSLYPGGHYNLSIYVDLQLSSYHQCFTDSVINSKGTSHLNKEDSPLGYVQIPYVKDVLQKLKCKANWYIRMIFKTEHTLTSSFVKTRPERDLQQMAHCICSIPHECDRAALTKQTDL
jgi:hypothetical protein